jgi:hypothetical protein
VGRTLSFLPLQQAIRNPENHKKGLAEQLRNLMLINMGTIPVWRPGRDLCGAPWHWPLEDPWRIPHIWGHKGKGSNDATCRTRGCSDTRCRSRPYVQAVAPLGAATEVGASCSGQRCEFPPAGRARCKNLPCRHRTLHISMNLQNRWKPKYLILAIEVSSF